MYRVFKDRTSKEGNEKAKRALFNSCAVAFQDFK